MTGAMHVERQDTGRISVVNRWLGFHRMSLSMMTMMAMHTILILTITTLKKEMEGGTCGDTSLTYYPDQNGNAEETFVVTVLGAS